MECRCCGQKLPSQALLKYHNMPKSAQFFPDKKEAEQEQGKDLLLFQCKFCGMIQLAGEPVPYYRDVIRASGVSQEMRRFRQQQFLQWVKKNQLRDRKVVEVGCGVGEYLEIMAETGADVYGIEHLASSVKQAVQNGHKVYASFLETADTKIDNAPYDGFYILNFLEHIPQPGEFLRGIANNLSDEAVGLVEVPNVDMILQENLYSELIQDHLLYFTSDTLCRLLEWNGFEVLSCRSLWHNYILSAEVRKRKGIAVNGFLQQQEAIQESVDQFLSRMERRGLTVAVWGAGHQALANLSLLSMSGRICCVIDSAKFKQNRLTPATHIPIVAPEILAEGKIGAVLIMAAGYSGEISKIIQSKYSGIIQATLEPEGVRELLT